MPAPRIHVTDAASRAIRATLDDPDNQALRIGIDDRFQYDLRVDSRAPGDEVVNVNGVTVLLDASSAARAEGLTLDFEDKGANDGGFTIDNPNAPREIIQLSPGDLKALMDAGEPFDLLDVRTPGERALAKIDGSRLLDQTVHDELMQGDRSRPLVFQCHHGMRSQSAAEYFQRAGFTRLYNLAGGIEAWSREIDPSVPRY